MAFRLSDRRGHNTRNGRRYYETFTMQPWRRPGNYNIYLLKLFISYKIITIKIYIFLVSVDEEVHQGFAKIRKGEQ